MHGGRKGRWRGDINSWVVGRRAGLAGWLYDYYNNRLLGGSSRVVLWLLLVPVFCCWTIVTALEHVILPDDYYFNCSGGELLLDIGL